MHIPLRYKVNGSIILTFLLLASLSLAIILPFQKYRLNRSIDQIEILLNTLVQRDTEQLANEIFDSRLAAIQIRIKEMLRVKGIKSISIFDHSGKLLATAGTPPPLKEIAPAENGDLKGQYLLETHRDRDGKALYYLESITFLEEEFGYIQIVYSLQQVEADQRGARLLVIGFLLAALLIMLIVLNLLLSQAIIGPVLHLRDAAHSIAEGDLNREIDMRPGDELGSLAASFEKMRDAIHEKIVRLRAEVEERKLAEHNLEITLDSIGDGVIATDNDGLITRLNPIAEELTGWPSSEALGKRLSEVFNVMDKNTGAALENPVTRILKSGSIKALGDSVLLQSRNGKEYIIADSGAPIRSEQGETIGVVLVFRDITEEKNIQDQLRQSQKMDAIGQLAGGIAHDFNNMLGGIMGAAELLSLSKPTGSREAQYITMIRDSAGRAADLTNKLLSFSRNNPPSSSIVAFHDIIEETILLLRNTIDRRISIHTDLKATSSSVIGDPSQLHNALLNLGINASHAMPDGGELTISSRVTELDAVYCNSSTFDIAPGSYLKIEVRDSGQGIHWHHLDKIFDPFFTTKDQGQGTGLGLAAVYGTIKQHRGAITVYSEPNVGTTFHILLPLAHAQIATEDVSFDQIQRGKGRILVVDDEEVMRLTAQAILEDLGYEVETAADGREAVAIFRNASSRFDLVLLDMVMPVMNGRDCFSALQQYDPDVCVVLSSGFTREEDLKELRSLGLKGFIRKPYLSSGLSQAVFKALQQ